METSSIENNNNTISNIPLDVTINNGYLKSASAKNNASYLPTNTATNNASTRPRVIQWDPHMGTDQSTISVVLEQAVSDMNEEIRPMKLVFGQLVVETNQQQQRAPTASPINSNNNSNLVWITLVAHVPKFSDTVVEPTANTNGNEQVTLSICIYDLNNKDTATDHWSFGVFTYKKGSQEAKQDFDGSSTSNVGRKRGSSNDDLGEFSASKRVNTNTSTATTLEDDQLFNQLLAGPFDESPGKNTSDGNDTLTELESGSTRPTQQPILAPQPSAIINQLGSSNQPYQPPSTTSNTAAGTATEGVYYGFNDYSSGNQSQSTTMPINIQPNTATSTDYGSTASNKASLYNTPMPYQGYSTGSSNSSLGGGSYGLPPATSNNSYLSYPSIQQQQPQPSLINNTPTQLQSQMPMNTSTSFAANTSGGNTNNNNHPFAGVLSKANLNITGDLMEMTYNWSQDEWTNGRRLVEFCRRQGSDDAHNQTADDETISEVECGFKTIDQEAYQQQRIRQNLAVQRDAIKKKPNPLVVSCIYWQERNDYFITSVDCIYLLEGLIGVQFTVEEKNRIRRNLEGFRPLTVSKCKPEFVDFFKLIMSFPHPKPRNIEKDVKVFPWKTLSNALKKIILKYTPSYSSTAVVNLNK